MSGNTMVRDVTGTAGRRPGSRAVRAWVALSGAVMLLGAALRGDVPADDRGSDSSEKSFMVILAITLGTAVTAAAVAFVATKTSLFK